MTLSGRLSGRGVLIWLSAFFAVIIAMNVYFVTLSVKTFSGEDEADPYLQGVEYNETLARRAEQARLGWHAEISANRLPSGQLQITARILEAGGRPQKDVSLKGELRHLADAGRDRPLIFRQSRPGTYVAVIGDVTPGSWEVLVNNAGTLPFEASRRIWAP
ncbi:MAG TPA: FixH family protein [Rhizomicrobium sp.]|nr:FixH family protein [Rhizomicrobium sp.]